MSDYMHEELILEILKTLPVKSVVKCRSVCKKWNTLICHPSFVSVHLQASLSRPPDNTPFLLLTSEKKGCEKYYLHYDNDGFDEFKQLQIPLFGYVSEAPVVGCCNGLICLQLFSRSDCSYIYYFLWNPSIQKYISLPRLRIDKDAEYLCVGFGFDSRTNDYKLLLAGAGSDNCWMKPYLFSLNHKRWKRVTAVYPDYGFGPETLLPFVNGAVHWLGHQNRNDDKARNEILGFDLSAEVFFEMSLPESLIGLWS
ncbi:F-box/kelch-repeat protein At3g06240-like [Hibiscus syriacus]|uniref:F-box/kelch-repeat protein At3g06240-like n=1 Tax=Hibiscus syriacus TaxID=106335 RepID=UPI001920B599|nr:F-box/kelch-repeat protein At3g06240-like [Hibiscus syriacus]